MLYIFLPSKICDPPVNYVDTFIEQKSLSIIHFSISYLIQPIV